MTSSFIISFEDVCMAVLPVPPSFDFLSNSNNTAIKIPYESF